MILQELLGIEFPIIQAPMAGVQGSALAVAVSNAGGHRGIFLSADLSTQVGTIALVPQIVRTVKVPVIAAGGIADGKGIAAAMALAAAGVQIGTAYMLCAEATTTAVHRAALKSDAARVWRVAKSRKEAI